MESGKPKERKAGQATPLRQAQDSEKAGQATPLRQAGTRLRGLWLPGARVAWIVVVGLSIACYVATIPLEYARYLVICTGSGCNQSGLTPENVRELQGMGLSIELGAGVFIALSILFVVAWWAVGFVIFWRRSDEPIALLVALMLVTCGAVLLMSQSLGPLAATASVWDWAIKIVLLCAETSLFLFFYLFPDGRFVPRWTWVIAALGVIIFLYTQFFAAAPFTSELTRFSDQWFLALVVTGVGAQLYRYWRVSRPSQRQQTKWIVLGTTAAIMEIVAQYGFSLVGSTSIVVELVEHLIAYLLFLFLPVCFGIAILRYRLWNIDPFINRTLVYSSLTACVVAMYVLVIGALSTLFQARGSLVIALVGTGLVAILFQPLRERLQRGINRLMYGERDNPYKVISELGQRLATTLAPDALLPVLVETVTHALKLPYAAITLKEKNAFTTVATCGKLETPSEELTHLPLVYQGEQIGELVLARRAPSEAFSDADQRLLRDLARQAGIAVHTVRLTTDLQRSRERLVTTREEERRRLRRDLHDGVGPTLAALNLQAGIIRKLIKTDPDAADALMVEWRREIRPTIGEIRRLSYDLRPPALDELGLVGAIRERAAQSSGREADALRIVVEAPDKLPPLPAATEVAAYRIVQEALTNVIHHAQAKTCHIRIWISGENDSSVVRALCLEITDDGCGLPEGHRTGVGLISMRERAEELGGTCVVERAASAGTRIWTQLLLAEAQ
jgi:signal transduction histidine kinase